MLSRKGGKDNKDGPFESNEGEKTGSDNLHDQCIKDQNPKGNTGTKKDITIKDKAARRSKRYFDDLRNKPVRGILKKAANGKSG